MSDAIARWLRSLADWLDGGAVYSNAPLFVEERRVVDLRYKQVVPVIAMRNAVNAEAELESARRRMLRELEDAVKQFATVERHDDLDSGGVVLTARLLVVSP